MKEEVTYRAEIEGSLLPGGGELTIAAMDEYSRAEIGRKTYRFVRRCMRDPELRAKIKARAAELQAEAEITSM